MTLYTFPFLYLWSRAALLNFNVSFEEVARVCGASRLYSLVHVTLPLLRPAIVAGLSLVLLYVVSDFGAVSLLRYQTFTYAVYQQMTGRYDYTAAAILSLLLVVLAVIFLIAVLIVAYVVHFLPAGLQTMEPALQQVTPNLEEAARTLGRTTAQTLRAITLPLVRGGFIVAWVLMFLQCMKELLATLLLRPVGVDTRAIRVWLEA